MITQEAVLDIAREAIYTTIITSAPLLLISLIVGLIVSKIGRASCRERVSSPV